MTRINRRELIALAGAAWPLAARAQQTALPVVGFLNAGSSQGSPVQSWQVYLKALQEMGFVEGRNVAFVYRTTGRYDQLAALAGDLVRRQVSVILASGNVNTALAVKAVTSTIPIVFNSGGDPVRLGLVASINRPGGNVTGVTNFAAMLGPKRFELMRELVPQAGTIGFLRNPANFITDATTEEMLTTARNVGQQMMILNASTAKEIDAAFATAQGRIGALLVNVDAFFNASRDQLTALAARYRIPTSYPARVFVEVGGLMSYSDDRAETNRQAGLYVGRILKGEKPADLPVLQPTKFDFAINLKAAKALGITFPQSFHLRADAVIE
jgi:putative ABC transport system substrate-binding protein